MEIIFLPSMLGRKSFEELEDEDKQNQKSSPQKFRFDEVPV